MVACLIASQATALLDSDKIQAYQQKLADDRLPKDAFQLFDNEVDNKHQELNLARSFKITVEGDGKGPLGKAPHLGEQPIPTPTFTQQQQKPPSQSPTFVPPKKQEAPIYKPPQATPKKPVPAKREPYSMCKQYQDPVIFQECIKFYVDQNE